LLSWYANAAAADWWAGEAFGARRFLSLFPLFAVGLSCWLARGARWQIGLVGVCVALNVLLLFQYQLHMKGLVGVAPYPAGWFDMFVTRFVVPFRLLAMWAAS
jgi:hypothetical protein